MARFMRKGITRFYFLPTIASTALAPTVAEITAGERLDPELAEVNGFMFSNSPIQTPDMASAFVSQIPGEDTVEDSNLVFYEDDTDNPVYDAQTKGTVGFIVIFPKGIAGATPATGDDCDVWPVQVASSSRQYTADNEAGKYEIVYTPTDPPELDTAVLA
jgi:hypothetical protein